MLDFLTWRMVMGLTLGALSLWLFSEAFSLPITVRTAEHFVLGVGMVPGETVVSQENIVQKILLAVAGGFCLVAGVVLVALRGARKAAPTSE